jgi:hypothetical protein
MRLERRRTSRRQMTKMKNTREPRVAPIIAPLLGPLLFGVGTRPLVGMRTAGVVAVMGSAVVWAGIDIDSEEVIVDEAEEVEFENSDGLGSKDGGQGCPTCPGRCAGGVVNGRWSEPPHPLRALGNGPLLIPVGEALADMYIIKNSNRKQTL